MTALRRLADGFEDHVAALLMAGVLGVLMAQVVTRYLLGAPLYWTEEVARHLFVWMVFFGASGAVRDRSHVAITLLLDRLGGRVRTAVLVLINVAILFFLGNVLYWGAKAVDRMWPIATSTLELPVGLVYSVLPITAALMILHTLARIADDLRGIAPAEPAAVPVGLD